MHSRDIPFALAYSNEIEQLAKPSSELRAMGWQREDSPSFFI